MKKIGYLRVSTPDQNHDRQVDGLKSICDELYVETASAVSKTRPFYNKAVGKLRPGDVFVVWDIDRAYRDAREALNELHILASRGVAMRIVNFPVDTTTAEGYFMFIIAAGVSELERRTLSRRTREGLAAVKARGRVLGRPRKLSGDQIAEARERLLKPGVTVEGLAPKYNVSRWTLSRNLRETVELR